MFSLVLMLAAGADNSYAQSSRRTGKARQASPSRYAEDVVYAEQPKTYYAEIGRVVGTHSNYAIVLRNSSKMPKAPDGWTTTLFCSDIMRNPKALLSDANLRHKGCYLYNVLDGEAAEGDIVIVRMSAPDNAGK